VGYWNYECDWGGIGVAGLDGGTVSEKDLEAELAKLRREFIEAVELAHQAIAMASAANVRVDGLAGMVANLEQRIRLLRVESKTISEIVG
jgi:hypothetical protein